MDLYYKQKAIKLISLYIIIITIFFGPFSGDSQEKSNVIIVGVLKKWPPQYSIDLNTKKPFGFAIEIFEAITGRANIDFQYRVFESWPELNHALKNNRVHIIPNIGITPERQKLFSFTVSYETSHVHTFVRQSNNSINSIENFKNITVGVVEDNKGLYLMQSRKQPLLHIYSSLA